MATGLLPDDLLLEILVRLPVQSLLRFRCVSGFWQIFITSPLFISARIHHNSMANSYRVLVRTFEPKADKKVQYKLCQDNESMDEIMTIDFPLVSRLNDFFRIVGCVNGLNANVRNLTIAPWCGLLSIFETVIWSRGLCLWVMKYYGKEESWVKQFVIECPAIVRSLGRNGNVILENIRGRLISYNRKTNQIEDSEIPVEGSVWGFHIKSYLKSLVLLDRMDAQLVL
ncbi:hypothetical protein Cgig2_032215 [Carnegiea gigantea]|uniref:F-box domain-containing protein n=1 Tax=Carnegiea gigantea TaxID=171969 RepID=A0A9Q1GQN5_9CARY|nr:hypothetical protein Cgig2_032215 [Carnegiea gigantea]